MVLWFGALSALLVGCVGSYQNQVVDDRLQDYERCSQEYHDAEKTYLNLLFNLERVPGDSFLLQEKKMQMQELVNLRSVLLQSRGELDDAIQQWELQIRAERGVQLKGAPEPGYYFRPQDPPTVPAPNKTPLTPPPPTSSVPEPSATPSPAPGTSPPPPAVQTP